MDVVTEFLAALLAGLAAILMVIGGVAAARYRDARLGLVAAALGLLSALGILALLHEISPRYGTTFGVAPVPLALAVISVALLYASLIRGHSGRSTS